MIYDITFVYSISNRYWTYGINHRINNTTQRFFIIIDELTLGMNGRMKCARWQKKKRNWRSTTTYVYVTYTNGAKDSETRHSKFHKNYTSTQRTGQYYDRRTKNDEPQNWIPRWERLVSIEDSSRPVPQLVAEHRLTALCCWLCVQRLFDGDDDDVIDLWPRQQQRLVMMNTSIVETKNLQTEPLWRHWSLVDVHTTKNFSLFLTWYDVTMTTIILLHKSVCICSFSMSAH